MSIEQTQDDIVKKFLTTLENEELAAEDVTSFGLAAAFRAPPNEETREEVISVPVLKERRGAVGYKDLARAFLWVLKNQAGVISFNWRIDSPSLCTINWIPGFNQETSLSDDEILSLAENIFKSRGEPQSITWVLGSPAVQIVHRDPMTF